MYGEHGSTPVLLLAALDEALEELAALPPAPTVEEPSSVLR
jgi:hypothetical protein